MNSIPLAQSHRSPTSRFARLCDLVGRRTVDVLPYGVPDASCERLLDAALAGRDLVAVAGDEAFVTRWGLRTPLRDIHFGEIHGLVRVARAKVAWYERTLETTAKQRDELAHLLGDTTDGHNDDDN